MVFIQVQYKLSIYYAELTSLVLYNTSKINNLHVSELLVLQTLAMLLLQGHSKTSTNVQAHNFYNTLASYNIKYNHTCTT